MTVELLGSTNKSSHLPKLAFGSMYRAIEIRHRDKMTSLPSMMYTFNGEGGPFCLGRIEAGNFQVNAECNLLDPLNNHHASRRRRIGDYDLLDWVVQLVDTILTDVTEAGITDPDKYMVALQPLELRMEVKAIGVEHMAFDYYARSKDKPFDINSLLEVDMDSDRLVRVDDRLFSCHGVDTRRFVTMPDTPTMRLLFVDSYPEHLEDEYTIMAHEQSSQRHHMCLIPKGATTRFVVTLASGDVGYVQMEVAMLLILKPFISLLYRIVKVSFYKYKAWSWLMPSYVHKFLKGASVTATKVIRNICHILLHFEDDAALRATMNPVPDDPDGNYSMHALMSYVILFGNSNVVDDRPFSILKTTGCWVTSINVPRNNQLNGYSNVLVAKPTSGCNFDGVYNQVIPVDLGPSFRVSCRTSSQ
jgi:hypothetical protein